MPKRDTCETWEWFSGSTGSHLHNLPPPFKVSSQAFVLSSPSRPMRPWQNPSHKRSPFPWKLHPTSRKKEIKGRPCTADLLQGEKGGFRTVWGERNERVKESYGIGKGKKAVFGVCPCPQAHLFFTVGTKHDICGERTERNMRLSALSGKRDHG